MHPSHFQIDYLYRKRADLSCTMSATHCQSYTGDHAATLANHVAVLLLYIYSEPGVTSAKSCLDILSFFISCHQAMQFGCLCKLLAREARALNRERACMYLGKYCQERRCPLRCKPGKIQFNFTASIEGVLQHSSRQETATLPVTSLLTPDRQHAAHAWTKLQTQPLAVCRKLLQFYLCCSGSR